jgi:glucose-6-phosphate dehydrogenase assembly protein OpcA
MAAEIPATTSGVMRAVKPSEVDSAVPQACLCNLVIYTEDPADEALISRTIGEYVLMHPCRVIVAISQPRKPAELTTTVCTHTFSDGGGKTVTCDQITLNVSGAAIKELASAIQPLLVADLPIYIWWRGIFLTQRMLVEQMLSFADRFIYDGVNWTNLHFTVLQVADFISKYDEKVGFTNFNWSRLRPWRESVADFFDAGVFEKEIWNISSMRVEYMSLPGSEEGYRFRSLLFVAWMAVQLEWEPIQGQPGEEVSRLQFKDKKGRPVQVDLQLLPQVTATSQSLQKIIMTAVDGDFSHTFTVERDHQEKLMVLRHQERENKTVLRKVPHSDSSIADLLYRELGRRVRNRVFEKSFTMAAKLLEMI